MSFFTFSVRSEEGYKVVPVWKKYSWEVKENILHIHYKEKAFSGDKTRELTFVFPTEKQALREINMLYEWSCK